MKKIFALMLITGLTYFQPLAQNQSQIDEVVLKYSSIFEWVIEPKYDDILEIPNCNILTAKEKKKYGFIDIDEKIIVPFKFGYATIVGEQGYALWAKNFAHWMYYIDVFNNGIAPFKGKFQYANLFNNGYAVVNGNRAVIDSTGKLVFPYNKGFINAPSNIGEIIEGKSDDLIPFKKYKNVGEGLSGYVNREGKWIIEAQYTRTVPRVGSFYPVGINEKYGFLDLKGNVVVETQYQLIKGYGESYMQVQKGEKWGLMNKRGELVVACEYDYIASFDNEGKAYYEKDKVYGYIYAEGLKILENGTFDRAPIKFIFGEVVQDVYKVFNFEGIHGKNFGICKFENDKCIVKIEPKYQSVRIFWHNDKQYSIVSLSSGLSFWQGLYNDKLELLIDPKEKEFVDLDPPNSSGYTRIGYKKKFGVVKLK